MDDIGLHLFKKRFGITDDLIPLKRDNVDLCFYGAKSSGKTLSCVFHSLVALSRGIPVVSNLDIEFQDHKINDLSELKDLKDCCLVYDDLEFDLSSKYIRNEDKKEILECTLNFGKRNVSPFLWTTKNPFEISKDLRRTLDSFIKVYKVLKYQPSTYEDYVEMKKYLNFYNIINEVIDAVTLKQERVIELFNLIPYSDLYDTKQEIDKLKKKKLYADNYKYNDIDNNIFGKYADNIKFV